MSPASVGRVLIHEPRIASNDGLYRAEQAGRQDDESKNEGIAKLREWREVERADNAKHTYIADIHKKRKEKKRW